MESEKKKRRSLAIILCITICVLSLAIIILDNFKAYEARTDERLEHILLEVESYYDNYEANEEELLAFQKKVMMFCADYLAGIMETFSQKNRDSLKQVLSSKNLYYITSSQTFSSDNAPVLTEQESLLEIVKKEKCTFYDGYVYAGAPFQDGWFLVSEKLEIGEELKNLFYIPSHTEDIICWNLEENRSVIASEEMQEDMSLEEFFGSKAFLTRKPGKKNGVGIGYNKSMGYFEYKQVYLEDNLLLIAYAYPGDRMLEFFRSLSMEILLIPLIILTLLHYAMKLQKNNNRSQKLKKKRNFGITFWVDTDLLYHLNALFVLGIVITAMMTGYVHLLSEFSNQNVRAISNLEGLRDRIQQSEDLTSKLKNYYEENTKDLAGMISWGIEQQPGTQLESSQLNWILRRLELQELTVFDEEGKVLASSHLTPGVKMNTDASSPDSACLDILNGKRSFLICDLPDHYEYLAMRLRNSRGFVRLTYDTALKEKIMGLDTFETAFLSCDFGDALKLYGNPEEKEALYMENPETLTIQAVPYSISEEYLNDNFRSFLTIGGKSYYVNTLLMQKKLLIHAVALRKILVPVWNGILAECSALLVAFFVLVCFTAVFGENFVRRYLKNPSVEIEGGETANRQENHQNYFRKIGEHFQEKAFQKTVSFLIRMVLAELTLVFCLDAIFSKSSLLQYLVSNKWGVGLNLFSFTKIIIVIILTWIISGFLQKMIRLISGNLDSRGITIGRMLDSMLQFGRMVFLVIYTLVQLGVSVSSLLAGAGLAGATLAIAGQSVVNDLLSGLFLVFEGKFGVGDWVTIGDWRGQVLEIGVRTTTIGFGDDVKIFNNSSLNGIIVWSKAMSGAICYVDIAYKEDVAKVTELVHANQVRYKKASPYIVEGPTVHGVTNLGSDGVTLRMSAYVEDQKYSSKVQRSILQVTKELFDENDITIPFPQIVVHKE